MRSICESCVHYAYDEEYGCYICGQDLDEDEMVKFITDAFADCPYYGLDNEYLIVRKQM